MNIQSQIACLLVQPSRYRLLDINSSTQPNLEGDTNFISIDRYNVLNSAFEEIRALENFKLTLEVSFYGKIAQDSGGPQKEFFKLCLREIKEKCFDQGLRSYLADEYEEVGKIVCLSIGSPGNWVILTLENSFPFS